jgi:hypothetical protein
MPAYFDMPSIKLYTLQEVTALWGIVNKIPAYFDMPSMM